MAAAMNHQPVLMPVAQRGTPDDCTKFSVVKGKGGNGGKVGGKDNTSTDASTAKATATKDNGKGGEGASGSSAAAASTAKNGGKNGKGGKGTSTTAATNTAKDNGKGRKGEKSDKATASSSAAATTAKDNGKGGKDVKTKNIAAAASTKAANNGGKGNNKGGKKTVKKIVEIETFFEFVLSLGGLPPAVGKKGDVFAVFEETFTDINSACSAACGHQWQSCISFSGPGFTIEKCEVQRTQCFSAAKGAKPTAQKPKTVTATVTVAATATVTGSVLATLTTETASETAVAVNTVAKAQTTPPPALGGANTESECVQVTKTVEVDPPKQTQAKDNNANETKAKDNGAKAKATKAKDTSKAQTTAAPLAASSDASVCVQVTKTVEVDPPSGSATEAAVQPAQTTAAASAAAPARSGALGGIAAPAVTDSGDATRPFLVNGNTFVQKAAAVQRSCDIQFNACANAVNGQTLKGVSVSDCQTQKDACGK